MHLKEVNINDFSFAPFKEIGENWGILSAGEKNSFNSMTVSWGAAGILWSKPAVFVFVRPQRYTYEFTEKSDSFSLSIMPEGYHQKIAVFGSKSGRDTDKYAESGLKAELYNGVPYVNEAKTVFICKKVAAGDIQKEWFFDKSIDADIYPKGDYHRMYVGFIEAILSQN